MTERAEIAQAVAKALGLKLSSSYPVGWRDTDRDSNGLERDGSNLFDPYWQIRCRDWLREHDYCVIIPGKSDNLMECVPEFQRPGDDGYKAFMSTTCPASEFYARAIHALEREER